MKNKLIISALITLASSIVFGQCNDLSVNTTIFSQTGLTTCGSGNDFNSSNLCGSNYMTGEDYVIRYTPNTTGCINIKLSNTNSWTGVFLTSACPNNGGGTCIGSNTNSSGNPTLTGMNVTAGQTYFITVSTFPSPNCTPFDIQIIACPPPITNNECSNAINVPVNPNFLCGSTISGTLLNATGSSQINNCYGTANDDVWFKFTATNTTHSIDLLNVTGSPSDLYHSVYNNNCGALGSALVCSDPNSSTVTGLTPGNTYLVRVYSWSNSSGATTSFDLCIGTPPPPPPNDNCAGAISVPVNPDFLCGLITPGTIASATGSSQANNCGGTANDDVWFKFTATNTTHSIDLLNVTGSTTDLYHSVYNNNCGALGSSLVCSDPNSSTVTGLTPGNSYLVRIYSWSSSTGATTNFDLCIGTPPPPPSNDECSGAINVPVNPDLLCGSITPGSIASATNSPQPNGCYGTANDDVWFSFTATNSTHTIDLLNVSGSTTDLYHSVYNNNCGALGTALECSDPNNSTLTGLTPGNSYLVRVYSWSSSSGATTSFNLCIGTPPPPPDNVNCANMSPICSGSAIAFTASSGGGTAPPGNNYDCLYSQPNPTWFYLEIDNSGSLSIDITAASDIDYAIWGPFADLATAQSNCSNLAMPKDCSYSASEIEQANISNVNSGEVYVLLITNYSNVIQSVFVNESASNTASTDCSIVPLPVELISFDAKAIGQEVQLTWVTASERDCDYFEIQRSADGKVWETIGFKKGNGNTTQLTNYSFYDKKPLKGVSYYRLKQVDFNGSLEFLPIKSVHFLNLSDIIQLHPNPTKDWVNVTANNTKIKQLVLKNSNGREVMRVDNINEEKTIINCKGLAAGVYFMEVYTEDNQLYHQRLVIQ